MVVVTSYMFAYKVLDLFPESICLRRQDIYGPSKHTHFLNWKFYWFHSHSSPLLKQAKQMKMDIWQTMSNETARDDCKASTSICAKIKGAKIKRK